MNSIPWQTFDRLERFLWAAVLIALPVTSFRYLPFAGADSQVKPLSFVPGVLLLLVLSARCLSERRLILWNRHFESLIIFMLIAAVASAIGILLGPVDLYSATYSGRMIRAWFTLGTGLIFLVTAMCMNQDEKDLKFTVKWIYIGLIAQMTWSLVQFCSLYIFPIRNLDGIQKAVMMAGVPPNDRINGLALEPSWLAAQVITLYLPWAMAAVLKGYSLGISRKWLIPIFASCLFILIFTYSRSGILITLAVVGLILVIAGWNTVVRAWKWMLKPFKGWKSNTRRVLEPGLRLFILAAILAGLAGGGYTLSRNKYFAQLWRSDKTNVTDYFIDIYAGPRLAYSWAGWTIFEQHPFTGVGLGGTGLYMINALPDWSHFNISETARLLSSDNHTIPNTKNLYIRLLAETGILGFWAFLAFYLMTLGIIVTMLRSRRKELTFLGVAGLMAWFAIVMLGLTQDSFAMPINWIPLGILIGMTVKDDRNRTFHQKAPDA